MIQWTSRLLAQEHGIGSLETLGVLAPNWVFRAGIRARHGGYVRAACSTTSQ
jgi:hypothetical protein